MSSPVQPVFRFAPSPNGALHLGHAYAAIVNHRMAREMGAKFLLRIEDIDRVRCTPLLEEQMLDDLSWLGIDWDEEPRRQSDHFGDYESALSVLVDAELVYPAFLSRREIRQCIDHKQAQGSHWPCDPDGSPHYPGDERNWTKIDLQEACHSQPIHSLRLNMSKAIAHVGRPLVFDETGRGPNGETGKQEANSRQWGDVVIARSDTPTSYHLSAVVDDALQGITHVVRGSDLFHATSVHRVLQDLLGFPTPTYYHHQLVLDSHGRKLSKSAGDTSLRALRLAGVTAHDVIRMIGLDTGERQP